MSSRRSAPFVAAWLAACLLSPVPAAAAEDFIPGMGVDAAAAADQAAPSDAPKFFTINAVLARIDHGRTSGAEPVRLAALPPVDTASDVPQIAITPSLKDEAAAANEPFGLLSFRAPEGTLWRKWRGVEADMTKEQQVLDDCRANATACPSHAARFLRLIAAVKTKSTARAKLEEVNVGVNMSVRYVSDLMQHGVIDRWSAPLATFATLKGDCEDYAIAKYVALREAGFPREDMRILLVRDRSVRQDHAVLAARIDGRWLILDNRWAHLTDDREATSLSPTFAIDHTGVQLFAAPFARRAASVGEDAAAPATATITSAMQTESQGSGGGGAGQLPLLM